MIRNVLEEEPDIDSECFRKIIYYYIKHKTWADVTVEELSEGDERYFRITYDSSTFEKSGDYHIVLNAPIKILDKLGFSTLLPHKE